MLFLLLFSVGERKASSARCGHGSQNQVSCGINADGQIIAPLLLCVAQQSKEPTETFSEGSFVDLLSHDCIV